MNDLQTALVDQLARSYTAFLLAGLVVAALGSRNADAGSRRRLRSITLLCVMHVVLVVGAAALTTIDGETARWPRLAALVTGGVAGVGMLVFGVFDVASRMGWPAPPILRDLVAVGALALALFAIAGQAGIDVTGFVATSAVLTAVIGLSMQDTLGNLVAGLVLQSDSSIRVDDWVKVEAHVGRVIEMRWRYTAIRTRNGETVFLPNSKLVKNDVMRLGRIDGAPTQWRRWVYFNVDFRHAPLDVTSHVQSSLSAASIPGVAKTPAPTCVLMSFEESYGRYAVRYWLTDLQNDDPTDSLVRAQVYAALKRAGIGMSIPAEARFITKETESRRVRKAEADQRTRVEALATVELFRDLSEEERVRLATSMTYAPFAPGEVMTQYGATANWLYLVIDGAASVRVGTGPDPDLELMRLDAGEFFGETSLLTGAPRTETVVALTDVECFRLGKRAFQDLLERRPELAEKVASLLAERQQSLDEVRAKISDASSPQAQDAVVLLDKIRRFFGLGDD